MPSVCTLRRAARSQSRSAAESPWEHEEAQLGSRCDEPPVDADDEFAGILLEEEQAFLDVYNRVSTRQDADMGREGEVRATAAWIAEKLVKINAARKQQTQAAQLGDEPPVDDDDEFAGLLLEEEQALLDVYNRVSARRGTAMGGEVEMLPTPAWIA
eukprot:COSAG03_NODE_11125_length_610_cov_1.350294_1_plen_156_part_01